MGEWKADKDPFSNALLETDTTVFHCCDITNEEEAMKLLSDIADARNADIAALIAERDEARAQLKDTQSALNVATKMGAKIAARLDAIESRERYVMYTERKGGSMSEIHTTKDGRKFISIVDYADIRAQLAAANAKLDKLREIVPEDADADDYCFNCKRFAKSVIDKVGVECCECGAEIIESGADTLRDILYGKEVEL